MTYNNNNNIYIFGENNVGINYKDETDFVNEQHASSISEFLPIKLVSFIISVTEYGFVFNWVTASEVNNDYFTLEYSIDGVNFNVIDYIHGAGTTSEIQMYNYYWHETLSDEIAYFRLKQTDFDGDYSYSDVIVSENKVCDPCSEKYESNKLKVKELGNRWFRNINGELIYCKGDNR